MTQGDPLAAVRVLPELNELNEFFWTSGADGCLRFLRCEGCGFVIHPPSPRCPRCLSVDVSPTVLSGRGSVHSLTVNHQPWAPGTPPYVIAVVELVEQPGLRLTTNVVDCDVDDVHIGMAVEVVFQQCEDVFLPLFRPMVPERARGAPTDRRDLARPLTGASSIDSGAEQTRGGPTREPAERAAIIAGVGMSDVGRRLGRSALELTLDACLAAIADAGLVPADIDGISAYPGRSGLVGPGLAGIGVDEVGDALRLEPTWCSGGAEGPAQMVAVVNAALAIAAGLCRHVLVWRTTTESTAQGARGRGSAILASSRATGPREWLAPFGSLSPPGWIGVYAQRHMHEFGTTREQLGQIALTARANAVHNPQAVYRDPLTMDEYLSARMISTPFGLYDCDVPVDGAIAVVVSHRDFAEDLPHAAVHVNAMGTARRGRPSWDQYEDLTTMMGRHAAAHLWSRTDLRPGDVDVAELYDGMSFLALMWLEALGFCGRGDSGPFVAGGTRIARDGDLPLNTQGGQLSAGRLHGYGFLHEACVQLRHEGGERQVGGSPEVAVVSNGGGNLAGCLLLTRGVR